MKTHAILNHFWFLPDVVRPRRLSSHLGVLRKRKSLVCKRGTSGSRVLHLYYMCVLCKRQTCSCTWYLTAMRFPEKKPRTTVNALS